MSHGGSASAVGIDFRQLGDDTFQRQTIANRCAAMRHKLDSLLDVWMAATALPTSACLFVQGVWARRLLVALALLIGRQILKQHFQSCIISYEESLTSQVTELNINHTEDEESPSTENATFVDKSAVTDAIRSSNYLLPSPVSGEEYSLTDESSLTSDILDSSQVPCFDLTPADLL